MTPEKVKEMSASYVNTWGTECPVCGSPHISGEEVEIEMGVATQRVMCHDCCSDWRDVYTLQGCDNINIGSEEN